MTVTRYNSKIGLGIVIFLLVVFAGVSIPIVYNKLWLVFAILLTAVGFIGYIFTSTYYLITGKDLIVKSGFMINKTISIDSIKEISESNNPLSSPANSLDRLEIKYDGNMTILISPKNKIGFLEQLMEINPKVELKVRRKL